MACNESFEHELHRYLNRELNQEDETKLKHHLMKCRSCQEHFQELKQLEEKLSKVSSVEVPKDLKHNIMNDLPEDSKVQKFTKILKEHPFISAAVVFFVMLFTTTLSQYHSNQQLSLSKQEGVITQDNQVIIPEDKVIEGDFIVKNAELVIKGKIKGDLTLVNSHIVSNHDHYSPFNSLSHHVEGKIIEVDRYFAWMYHKIEYEFKNFVTLVSP